MYLHAFYFSTDNPLSSKATGEKNTSYWSHAVISHKKNH